MERQVGERPLVGRRAELRRLDAAVERAAIGRGGAVLLSGAAGAGKSRLAEEALGTAARRGFLVLRGTAFPLHEDLVYAPFLESIGSHLARLTTAERHDLSSGLPELGRLFSGLPPAPPSSGDPALDRTRLLDAVAQLVGRLATPRPLALLLDDLHFADPASQDLLVYLTRGLAGRAVLVLACYRSDEVVDPRLGRLVRGLRRSGADEVEVGGLDRADVTELAAAVLGDEPPASLLDELSRRGADTPLFVSAVVSALLDSGALHRRGLRWVIDHEAATAVPPVVRDLVLDRLDRLAAPERDVLDWVVVAGEAATAATLPEAVGRNVEAELRGLVAGGLLVEVDAGVHVLLRPSHPLITEVADVELPVGTRQRHHAAVASALERAHPVDVRQLAHHYRGAGRAAAPSPRILDVLLAAADRADSVLAAADAVVYLTTALDVAAVVRPDVVADLRERLGHAQRHSGQPAAAARTWLQASAVRVASGDPVAAARLHSLAGMAIAEDSRVQEAEQVVAAGLALLGTDERSADARLELRLRRIQLLGRLGDREALDREAAVLLADRADDPRSRAAVELARAEVAFIPGRITAASGHAAAAIAAAVELDDPTTLAYAYRFAGICELSAGRFAAAASASLAEREVAERVGWPAALVSPSMVGLLVGVASDAWDDAQRTADSVLAFGLRTGTHRAIAGALGTQAYLSAHRGRLGEAAGLYAEAREAAGQVGTADRHIFAVVDTFEAELALVRGDLDRAVELSAASMTSLGQLPAITVAGRCRALLAVGEVGAATAVASMLAELGAGPWPDACAQWMLGLVAAADGRPAVDALRAGVDGLDTLGLPFQAARARLDLAQALAVAGNRRGAVDAATAALGVFERYDARPSADSARRRLRELGERPTTPARRVGRVRPAGELSDREREVVGLVAVGLSNVEVANRLFISPRTVTTHLQHVYSRLDLPSRTALVRWAAENGVSSTGDT